MFYTLFSCVCNAVDPSHNNSLFCVCACVRVGVAFAMLYRVFLKKVMTFPACHT
jgi:hypothetical protein